MRYDNSYRSPSDQHELNEKIALGTVIRVPDKAKIQNINQDKLPPISTRICIQREHVRTYILRT